MYRKEDADMDEKEHWGGNERLLFELILETYLSLCKHFIWSLLDITGSCQGCLHQK